MDRQLCNNHFANRFVQQKFRLFQDVSAQIQYKQFILCVMFYVHRNNNSYQLSFFYLFTISSVRLVCEPFFSIAHRLNGALDISATSMLFWWTFVGLLFFFASLFFLLIYIFPCKYYDLKILLLNI